MPVCTVVLLRPQEILKTKREMRALEALSALLKGYHPLADLSSHWLKPAGEHGLVSLPVVLPKVHGKSLPRSGRLLVPGQAGNPEASRVSRSARLL